MELLIAVLIGAVAGWLAGVIMKSNSNGVLVNIILGIAGGFVGAWLFKVLGVSIGSGLIGAIITATIGAAALILVGRLVFKGK